MNSTSPRARSLACTLLATTAACGMGTAPAAAQVFGGSIQAYVSPPAEKLAVTPGNVDIRTGRYAHDETDLSIGGEDGLELARTMDPGVKGHVLPFANFSHNWDIMLTERRVDIKKGNYEQGSGTDFRLGVRYGGRSDTFDFESTNSGTAFSSPSSAAKLSYTGSRTSGSVVYTYQAADGTLVVFRPLGNAECSSEYYTRCAYVSQVTRPDGTKLDFEYDSSPGTANQTRLRSVVSNRGYALLLEYGGSSWNVVSKACVLNLTQAPKPSNNLCPTGTLASSSYSYTSLGGALKLASATDAAGSVWGYTYSGTPTQFDMGFVKPGQTTAWLTNHIFVAANEEGAPVETTQSQNFADGSSYSYAYYDSSAQTAGTVSILAGGEYADATGATTKIEYAFPRRPISLNPPRFNDADGSQIDTFGDAYYQATPGPAKITDPLNRVTTYDYCDRYMAANLPARDTQFRCVVTTLQSYTDPKGIKTELSYDGSHNVTEARRHPKPGSTLPDIVVKALYDCFYPKSCTKPTQVTDPNGNITRYEYSPDHGGVTKETGPAVDGVQPQKRYTYEQRYAWVSNGAGGWTQSATPVWLLTKVSLCKKGAAATAGGGCQIAGDEVVTTYDYGPNSGPNNLLLRGMVIDPGGLNLRTCYTYDALGNRLSETKPRAGLAQCQ